MFAWIKKWGRGVLLGIACILAALLGLKYERGKIAKLKREAELSKLQGEIAVDGAKKETAKNREQALAETDDTLEETIEAHREKGANTRQAAKETPDEDLADAFNDIYGSGHYR